MPRLKLKNGERQPNIVLVSSLAIAASYDQKPEKPAKHSNLYLKNLSLYFSQFCEKTTLHGIKFVGERGRYFIEKFIWFIIITIACTLCVLLIRKTYVKWQTSPVIVTFATTETPISEIPFPAVTICPEAKFNPEIFNFTKVMIKRFNKRNLTQEEEDYLELSSLICDGIPNKLGLSEIKFTNRTIKWTGFELLLAIHSVSSEFDPFDMTTVKWLGEEIDNYLSSTLTTEGLCYTFNKLSDFEIFRNQLLDYFNLSSEPSEQIREWSLEDGYAPGDNTDSYPRRTFVSGIEGGFVVDGLFTNHSHLDSLCHQSVRGYKVVLHHPSEKPNMQNFFLLPLDRTVLVGVKPTMTTVSKEVLHYEPQSRQCYFAREKYLSLFKFYTQENCLVECLANYTLSQCECMPFYMPFWISLGVQICGPGSKACVKNSKSNYLNLGNSSNLDNQQCGCLPSCTSLTYDVEISQTDWDWQDMFKVLQKLSPNRTFPEADGSHFSKLIVYFKDLQFLTSKRNEMYGYIDFFSNMGGLLGLFIGFSVTSVIEIIYFLTLRLICNIKKYGRGPWCGEPELIYDK